MGHGFQNYFNESGSDDVVCCLAPSLLRNIGKIRSIQFGSVRFGSVRLYNRRDMKQHKCHTNNKSVRVYPICLFLSLKIKILLFKVLLINVLFVVIL